jgi:tryptophan synthase beta subunit
MWGFLLGGAIGYLLGSRAGRERYDEIVRTYRRVIDHPAMQGAAGVARAKITEVTSGGMKNGQHRTARD